MKLPNGFGSVYKLSGKRRRPWVARKTTGWTEATEQAKSHPIYQFIGYYPNRAEALTALTEYNKNPFDVQAASITFSEVYDKWSARKFDEISRSNMNGYKASYKVCEKLYNMRFCDIKLDHLQAVVDQSGKNYPTLRKLKVLFGQLFEYAVVHEIIPKDRDMVQYLDISRSGNPNSVKRSPFSKPEIKKLWKWQPDNDNVSIILMLIYSGVRIGELLNLKRENVNLDEKWFDVVASKTDAGIRKVPIADKTYPLFQKWMSKGDSDYVLSSAAGDRIRYSTYIESYWGPVMEALGMKHKPHDTRHTCISLLTMAGVDERMIKKIVGHKGQGITQQVYTHIDIEGLRNEINKI